MATSNNITTSTVTINNYPSTYINAQTKSFILTKVCNKCHQIQNITEFTNGKTYRDGYRNQCKNCRNNYIKQHRKELNDEQKN